MHPRILVMAILSVVLTGCVNLKVVGEYAKASATFASDTRLAQRFRDTYQREQPYLDDHADQAEKVLDPKRQASYLDLVKIQQGLVNYMNTLAKLSGEDTTTAVINIGKLDTNLSHAADYGVNTAHVEALASLTNIVVRGVTASKQKSAIHRMVVEADPHVQKLAAALETLVKVYGDTNRNEKAMVLNVLKFHIPATNDPKPGASKPKTQAATLLLNRLARAQLQAKTDEYEQMEPLYPRALQGWITLAQGHRTLAEGLSRESAKDLLQTLKPMTDDLKTFKQGL